MSARHRMKPVLTVKLPCKALLLFHWQGHHALKKTHCRQGGRPGSSLRSRSNRRPPAVACAVKANRGPAMYIANKTSVKDLHPLVHFPPCPYNLLIVSELSEFVTVTFRKYCTKKKIALNKNYEKTGFLILCYLRMKNIINRDGSKSINLLC